MRVSFKTFYWFASDAPRRTVELPFARFLFQTFQLVVEFIVLPVRNGRISLNVIFVSPFIERVDKFADSVHILYLIYLLLNTASDIRGFK